MCICVLKSACSVNEKCCFTRKIAVSYIHSPLRTYFPVPPSWKLFTKETEKIAEKLKNQNSNKRKTDFSCWSSVFSYAIHGFRFASEKNQPEKATKIFGGDICGMERRQSLKACINSWIFFSLFNFQFLVHPLHVVCISFWNMRRR